MTETTTIPIDAIVWDPKIYPRTKWSTDTVARYADALEAGEEFPPVVVELNDDAALNGRLLDGKHRELAHRKAGRTEIRVERHRVPEGMSAKLYAATLSARHGDRMSNADLKALARESFDPELGGDPARNVTEWGRMVGVAHGTVFGWVGDIVNRGLEERRAKVIRLTRLGWTQQEIAALLDVTRTTITGDVKDVGSDTSDIRDMLAKGLPEADAAKRWNLPAQVVWSMELDGLDDADRLQALGIKVQPYDVWNWSSCHDLMGDAHPGRIPGELVCHLLYFLTKPGQLVVDPMAGSGTTLDACLLMGRKARGYDIDLRHERVDVEQHDLTDGWPDPTGKADLIVWDPPYYDKMDHTTIGGDGYIDGSISGMSPDEYMAWLAKRFDQLAEVAKPGARLAFIMSDWTPEHAKAHDDHPGLFVWDYARRITSAGLTLTRHIQAPLQTQLVHPDIVNKFRASRRLARLVRYVLVAEKP